MAFFLGCSLAWQNLYNNLTYMYPESDIWIIGHSLGGGRFTFLPFYGGRAFSDFVP